MKRAAVLMICLVSVGCVKVETASIKNVPPISNQTTVAATPTPNQTFVIEPTVEKDSLLESVTPQVKLNSKQKKLLDKALPPQVREILEKADKFELVAEVRGSKSDPTTMNLRPNLTLNLNTVMPGDRRSGLKEMILESFYADVATDEGGADCYEPHHGLRASYGDKTVEIEICFSCAKFYGKSSVGDFEGTIRRENRQSENLFNELIVSMGKELK